MEDYAPVDDLLTAILRELGEIKAMLSGQARDKPPSVPRNSTTGEAAELLCRTPFTVREWCRLGRVNAVKRVGGVGRAWMIPADEVARIRNVGLLPRAGLGF